MSSKHNAYFDIEFLFKQDIYRGLFPLNNHGKNAKKNKDNKKPFVMRYILCSWYFKTKRTA